MTTFQKMPARNYRFFRGPVILYSIGLGGLIGWLVLLLISTGRKSGLPRQTPLQYDRDGEDYIVISARGEQADWVRNLRAASQAEVRIGARRFTVQAELITDPGLIAQQLLLRYQRRPRFVGTVMRAEGLPVPPSQSDLEQFAAGLVMARLHPRE